MDRSGLPKNSHGSRSFGFSSLARQQIGDRIGEPRYVFSISRSALPQRPWRTGVVYLLPCATFEPEPPYRFGEIEVHTAQRASPVPVAPLARLDVAPEDFPFLAQIRGHDDARLQEYATAMQTGAPWPDDGA